MRSVVGKGACFLRDKPSPPSWVGSQQTALVCTLVTSTNCSDQVKGSAYLICMVDPRQPIEPFGCAPKGNTPESAAAAAVPGSCHQQCRRQGAETLVLWQQRLHRIQLGVSTPEVHCGCIPGARSIFLCLECAKRVLLSGQGKCAVDGEFKSCKCQTGMSSSRHQAGLAGILNRKASQYIVVLVLGSHPKSLSQADYTHHEGGQ